MVLCKCFKNLERLEGIAARGIKRYLVHAAIQLEIQLVAYSSLINEPEDLSVCAQ